MTENKQLSKVKDDPKIKLLDSTVVTVIANKNLGGFEKTFLLANAMADIQTLLTAEYMKPIMALQGNKLGFKTDRDLNKDGSKGPGYPEPVVKNCLIEAVLMGLQPVGNQFNIIAGSCYPTKEGMTHLLNNFEGLSYKIIPMLPRMKEGTTSAAVVMKIEWMLNGVTKKEEIDFAVKVNAYMGTDAVIGKAQRKARAWLYSTITGVEIAEGDVTDADVISTTINEIVPLEDLQMLFDMKKEFLSPEELELANRIIEKEEGNNYKKLYDLLSTK